MSDKNLFVELEHKVLDFWEENNSFEKLREKNAGNEMFRFVDGPVTANNPIGIHHAWGRALKDTFIRYHAMKGYDCRYQNGFDAQGLWVEVEVEKDLGFKTKKDIEDYGMGKFTKACVDRVDHFSKIITKQSIRLGQWMDWENSYYTNTDANIEGIWHFLKVCNENNWIDREYKPMPWCPRCGTSLSEHEMTGSYKLMTHDSIFFKVPVKELGAKMVGWTTTPWTLTSNVALAVNPKLDYAKVKVKSDEMPLIVAKEAIKFLEDREEVLDIFKGEKLIGLAYETLFPDFEAQAGIEHKIVSWDEVDEEEGTGIVHIAPGCGIEDFELGLELGLAQIMPVDDTGVFLPEFGFLTGKRTSDVTQEIFDYLTESGKVYKTEPYEHSYPVCWRCKSEIIFRLVPAWYILTEELRPRLIANASTVNWDPASTGKRMHDWLTNMGDWNISRKRYYGMPLPFYPCEECEHVTIIGSKQELRDKAVDGALVDELPQLHRPWIDEIKVKCDKCGSPVQRVTDIGDVWLDAGIVPFVTLGYFEDKKEWERNFPAEWITEMHEQIRLWFYSMLFMSTVLEDRAPFEHALSFGMVVQEDGTKFSKTGTMIPFDEAAESIGADTIRYMYAGAPYQNDIRFGYNLADEATRKMLGFWNIYTFYDTYASIDKPSFKLDEVPTIESFTLTDKWLIVRTNEFLVQAKEHMDDYNSHRLVSVFEVFVDDISNWYIRLNRRRFWKAGDDSDKKTAYWTLLYALKSSLLAMAPIIPFMTEYIWQELVREIVPESVESIHHSNWPEPLELFENTNVLAETEIARELIATALRLRNENQLKVRQPLSELLITASTKDWENLKQFEPYILSELNIKKLVYVEDESVLEEKFAGVNFAVAGRVLKQDVNKMKQTLENLSKEDGAKVATQIEAGKEVYVPSWDNAFSADLFTIEKRAKDGIVSDKADGLDMVVALNTVLTDDLRMEGFVRDIVRQSQILRKEAGFDVEERIVVSVTSDDAFVVTALETWKDHMQKELLAQEFYIDKELSSFDKEETCDLDGVAVKIQVKRV